MNLSLPLAKHSIFQPRPKPGKTGAVWQGRRPSPSPGLEPLQLIARLERELRSLAIVVDLDPHRPIALDPHAAVTMAKF
jgi:hypothetical protein